MTTKIIDNESLLESVKGLVNEGHSVTLKVKGYSMRPFLEHCRDYAVLQPIQSISKGDVVLARIAKGRYVLHRIIKIDGDQITLMGDGNLKGKEYCLRENIIAIAQTFIVNDKTRSTSSFRWRIGSALWPRNTFLRRILLAFYRRICAKGIAQKDTDQFLNI